MLRCSSILILGGWVLLVPAARADHFTIDLEAKGQGAAKKAKAETAALGAKPGPRGVLEAKVGEQLTVKWTLANAAPKAKVKNVVVHFFVVKEEEVGQVTLPRLDKDVWVETALTMDFQPADKNQGELTFVLEKPGAYLLRLETIGAAAGADGHEHFAALDLLIR